MTRTSSLEVSIKTHINCTLNIFACFHACFALLCMYCVLIAPSVDILCIFYYCIHGCICQLDIKENDDDDDDDDA